jgi:type III restriction enzyme
MDPQLRPPHPELARTAIWLTEVAPHSQAGRRLLDRLAVANKEANPELNRLALTAPARPS